MTRALISGESRLGFCAARPPGHHAESGKAMGFCLFNNIAIAAALATSELGLERVMIIDWDVHHGNGTAELFRARTDVLFSSIHQYGIFPGSGALRDVGSAAGEGYTINLPVPARSQGDLWCSLIAHVLVPSALAFEPQLILVSAGFDAHLADPLAGCELREDSFASMAALVGDLARTLQVPLGLVLEGGYEPRALAASVRATLAALGEQASAPQVRRAPLAETMAGEIARYWPL
jgi:acetoin utilization deacetylase AcuC-like enzyme